MDSLEQMILERCNNIDSINKSLSDLRENIFDNIYDDEIIESFDLEGFESSIIDLYSEICDDLVTESTFSQTMSKVSTAVSTGVKTIIEKIKQLIVKIKNFFKSIFRPTHKKISKQLVEDERVIDEAFKHINKPYKKQKKSPDSKNGSTSHGSSRKSPDSKGVIPVNDGLDYISTPNQGIKLNPKAMQLGMLAMKADIAVKYDEYKNTADITLHPCGRGWIDFDSRNTDEINNYILPMLDANFSKSTLNDCGKNSRWCKGEAWFYDASKKVPLDSWSTTMINLLDATDKMLNHPNLLKAKEANNQDKVSKIVNMLVDVASNVTFRISMRMKDVNRSMAFKYKNPFTDVDLDVIEDPLELGKFIEYILIASSIKYSPRAYYLVKVAVRDIGMLKKWINSSSDAFSGSTRIALVPKNGHKVYKYPLNRKGLLDTREELRLTRVIERVPELAKYFALPFSDSLPQGTCLVLPKATDVESIPPDKIHEFEAEVREIAAKHGLSLSIEDLHDGNFGKLNGRWVMIDFGNCYLGSTPTQSKT